MSKAGGEKPEAAEDKLAGPSEKLERADKCEKVSEVSGSAEEPKRPTSGGGDLTIYLFGRTGREKEEWFRRFLLASRMKSEGRGGSLPGICKSGEFETEVCAVSHTNTQTAVYSIRVDPSLSRTHTVFAQTHINPHSHNSYSLEYVTAQPSDLCINPSLGTANPLN